jgi:DNA replication protein DnaC
LKYKFEFNYEDCWFKGKCGNEFNSKGEHSTECNRSCLRYVIMHYLMAHSRIPKSLQYKVDLIPQCELDSKLFQMLTAIKDDAVNFVQNGSQLFLTSDFHGNGKTAWALRIMKTYFAMRLHICGFHTQGVYINTAEFLAKYREYLFSPSFATEDFKELLRDVIQCNIVVWDDVTSTRISSADYENFMQILDKRPSGGKCNIFTGSRRADLSTCGPKFYNRLQSWSINANIAGEYNPKNDNNSTYLHSMNKYLEYIGNAEINNKGVSSVNGPASDIE